MSKVLRLKPELVPRLLYGISAQELLSSARKRRIRPHALDEARDGRCLRCGALGRLDKDCHAVVHVDQVPAGCLDHALQHLADVDGITRDDAQALVNDAYAAGERRPVFLPWRVEVGSDVVARYPDMALLPERARAKIGPVVEAVRRIRREP